MKRSRFVLIALALTAVFACQSADAALISFLNYAPESTSIQGVDNPGLPWSTSDTMTTLGTDTLTLLSGEGSAIAKMTGLSVSFTHRGTRGLGVNAGESDEIDAQRSDDPEVVTFDFTQGVAPSVKLTYLELRSLFKRELANDKPDEQAIIRLYDKDSYYENTLTQLGSSAIGQYIVDLTPSLWGGNIDFSQITKIVFTAPASTSSVGSDYAIALLEVEASGFNPVPEPATLMIWSVLGAGAAGASALRRRRGRWNDANRKAIYGIVDRG